MKHNTGIAERASEIYLRKNEVLQIRWQFMT